MPREYIIQIGEDESYPFGGNKHHYNRIIVRSFIVCSSQHHLQEVSKQIDLLSKINLSSYIIQIERVVETSNRKFIVDYQYVAQPLKNTQRLKDNSLLSSFKEKLQQVCQVLARSGIKHEFKIEDIGINEEGMPKIFLGLKFKVIQEDIKRLSGQYQIYIDKFMELNFNFRDTTKEISDSIPNFSDYSLRLDKKLNEIEGKLQKRHHRKGSSSKSSNSDKSKSKSPHQGNIVTESLASRQYSNSSFSSSLTSNSCISGFEVNRTKIHKSSFGDYSTTSYRLNQQKQDSLTKRISTALERTQTAFKIYEKHSHKKHR